MKRENAYYEYLAFFSLIFLICYEIYLFFKNYLKSLIMIISEKYDII